MNNLISNWIAWAKQHHGSLQRGVNNLNKVCRYKLETSHIYAMQHGKRGVPACISRMMTVNVLPGLLEKYEISKGTDIDYTEFLDSITLPVRKK